MRFKISTVIGEFSVWLTYFPSADDNILLGFTKCINDVALPLLQKGLSPDEVFTSLNEAELEKKLYDSTKASDGAGIRLTFSLKERKIDASYKF